MLVIHNSNEKSIIYATTKMESRVVIMCVVPVKVRHVHSGKEIRTYAMLYCWTQGAFINTDLAKKLEAKSMKSTIKMKFLNGKIPKNWKKLVYWNYKNKSDKSYRIIPQKPLQVVESNLMKLPRQKTSVLPF